MTYNGIPIIELKEIKVNGGYKYEAIKDGKVISTRKSVRKYVAATVKENKKKIVNGVGRMDLLSQVLKNNKPDYIAMQLEGDPE